MGCWNETCSITNLPILDGEPVVAFVLQNNPYRADADKVCVYPDDIWAPVGFPIFGDYADYGNMEHIQTHPWNRELLHLDDPDKADFDEPVLFIHAGIYRNIIDHIGSRIPYGQTKPYRVCLKEKLEKMLADKRTLHSGQNPFKYGTYTNIASAQFLYEQFLESTNDEDKRAAVDTLIDCHLFYHALLLLRKGYRTQSGTGSQSMETALHILVARFTIEHAQNMFMHDDEPEFLPNGNPDTIYFYP